MKSPMLLILSLLIQLITPVRSYSAVIELLNNGGFESGTANWNVFHIIGGSPTSVGIVNLGNARSGSYYAYLGDFDSKSTGAKGAMWQLVEIPENATSLKFSAWINVTSDEASTSVVDFDRCTFLLKSFDNGGIIATLREFGNRNQDPHDNKKQYVYFENIISVHDLKGKNVIIYIQTETDASYSTTFRIDDMSVMADVPDEFVITSIAGPGGTITPQGPQRILAGNSATFSATPDAGKMVESWFVDSLHSASEVLQYSIESVSKDTEVRVTFKEQSFRLDVVSNNGRVIRNPDLQSYPKNSTVEVEAKNESGYSFSHWSGDSSGEGSRRTILMNGNKLLRAHFIRDLSPVVFEAAQAEDKSHVDISFPTEPGWRYVLEVSFGIKTAHASVPTVDVAAVEHDEGAVRRFLTMIWSIIGRFLESDKSDGARSAVSQIRAEPIIPKTPFLIFPISGVQDPYKATITAVMDHDGKKDGSMKTYRNEIPEPDGVIYRISDGKTEQFTGRIAKGVSGLFGYTVNSSGREWVLDFKYFDLFEDGLPASDKRIIWYDGHEGYDFAYPRSTDVVASADGILAWSKMVALADYDALVIRHSNGHTTYYLHLSSWAHPEWKDYRSMEDPPLVSVAAGTIIGKCGNKGVLGIDPNDPDDGVHLHFEVREGEDDSKAGNPVDPYGKLFLDGTRDPNHPDLWINGHR